MSKTPSAKDGLRFDWYPILQADFIDDLAAEVMAIIEAARTSTRGSSKAAAEERTQQQLSIAKPSIVPTAQSATRKHPLVYQ